MKRKFILLTLVITTLIVPANLQAFESTVEEELQTPWEGFGYNQWGFARESDGNTFKPWSDDLWKTTTERILAIKPSLVRLPVIRDWFNKDDDGNNLPIGTYNWDSKYMQAYFKIMDLYKEHDIKVMSGFWVSDITERIINNFTRPTNVPNCKPTSSSIFLEQKVTTKSLPVMRPRTSLWE